MKGIKAVVIIMATALFLAGCGSIDSGSGAASDTVQRTESMQQIETASEADEDNQELPNRASGQAFYADLAEGQPVGFECADGWCNGSMFYVTWRKQNVQFEEQVMKLVIDEDATPAGGIPYSGGEFRSKEFYQYGRYEVSMKAMKKDGVVSSFFTYTGPSDHNPWDEIDVEILGKDTTKVQFNYFTNGKGNHEYMHELGFDASEEFHTYGFEWHADKIIWFVDGVEVHRATESIPVTPGKMMMNAWCGTGVDDWLAAFDATNLPASAEYQWIRFTPFE